MRTIEDHPGLRYWLREAMLAAGRGAPLEIPIDYRAVIGHLAWLSQRIKQGALDGSKLREEEAAALALAEDVAATLKKGRVTCPGCGSSSAGGTACDTCGYVFRK